MNGTTANFLKDQLNKPPEDSKKWIMAMYGLKGIGVGFAVGVLMIAFMPTTAAHITTLVQIFMTAWGGVVGIYLGAQGSVEFKATSALANTQDTKDEHITVDQGSTGAPEVKPYGQIAKAEL